MIDFEKIIAVHNYYQLPGGEDQVFASETALLESQGHEVLQYVYRNEQVKKMGYLSLLAVTLWNQNAYSDFRNLLHKEKPQLVHCHNTFPLLSPAIYYAAKAEGVPVVQTLHNYRLLCPNGLFFRDGFPCEDCLGKTPPWPGIVHRCYRDSLPATSVVALMLTFHRLLKSWERQVNIFITLTDFARAKFIKGGLPPQKIMVKPNFVFPDPGIGIRNRNGKYFLYAGRLEKEKGLDTLLNSWKLLGKDIPLKIAGSGPMSSEVIQAAAQNDQIEYLGQQPRDRIQDLMKEAWMLVFPSKLYEGFPLVIAEAFAAGLPVIGSNLGSMSLLIKEGQTGFLFSPGNASELAAKVKWSLTYANEIDQMSQHARREYENKYTAEKNYQMLADIYKTAVHFPYR